MAVDAARVKNLHRMKPAEECRVHELLRVAIELLQFPLCERFRAGEASVKVSS